MIRPVTLALLATCLGSTSAFVVNQAQQPQTTTALQAKQLDGGQMIKGAAAAALFLGSVLVSDPAFAFVDSSMDFGSTQVVAGRSGGRGGGRVMRAPMRGGGGRAPMRAPMRSPTQNYSQRTTIVRPMMVSPMGGMGYGYNPLGGLGMGYALGGMGNNNMRDNRQENEIQRNEFELKDAEKKNMELENRIEQLEQAANPQAASPQVSSPPAALEVVPQ